MFSAQENLRKLFKIIKTYQVFLLTAALAFICSFSIYFTISINRPNKLVAPVTLIIKPGYSSIKIASTLQENKIIDSKWMFLLYAKTVARKKKLVAGEYEFLPGQNLKQIIKIIRKGESIVRKIKIPEGYTSAQIIDLLLKEDRLVGEILEEVKEGSLFPDTYYFKYGDLRSKILRLMKEKMRYTLDSLLPKLGKNNYIDNEEKLLTLASIVEKEAGNNEEKPIIASIFLNRLKKNMILQADPTVIYAITMGKAALGRLLTRKDLSYESQYNTYLNKGLPPGPIACPGLKSLQAVVSPAFTNYLYFVSDGKGGHNYSANLGLHNEFVKVLREIQKNTPSNYN